MSFSDIDWKAIGDDMEAELKTAASEFLQGAQADLESYVTQIATDTTEAIRLGREDLLDELKAQLKVIGEAQRLRASDRGWDLLQRTLGHLSGIAVKVVGALV